MEAQAAWAIQEQNNTLMANKIMNIHFYKYQGTGNDFILIDNYRGEAPALSKEQIALLCDRRFGIGADGLMLLEAAPDVDFRMVYYNADGGESTMCGNGGRCIVAFARRLGIIKNEAKFIAIDGLHHATINADDTVSLQMQDVTEINHQAEISILNTGSPHFIKWVEDVLVTNVFADGRAVRNEDRFAASGGINVNFVQRLGANKLHVRTYERGVEDETLSCGTGVTAAAIAASADETGTFETAIETPGGSLKVQFTKETPGAATQVILIGPATFVFKGEISL